MTKIGTLIITLLITTGLWAQTSNWNFDNSHSSVEFSIDHMVISEVTGNFSDYTGSVSTNNDDFEGANIDFIIEVASINTNNGDRDDHLRGADFFNVAKYPQITFKSTSFKKVSGKKYKLSGDFTMHGITKAVTFDVNYGGTAVDPWGNTKAGFKLTGELNRKDYGLTWNKALETGGLVVGDKVLITVRIELTKVK